MKFKRVLFARKLTLQIQCELCLAWQFDTAQLYCCDCGKLMDRTELEEDYIEYRVPPPDAAWARKVSKKIRQRVYENDEFVCQYCGVWCFESWSVDPKALTIDHRVPVSAGGGNAEDNLVTACRECNILKSNKRFSTFEEAREYLEKKRKER